MPYVFSQHTKMWVTCPIKGKIEIRWCYGCPYYKFRNDKMLVCEYEFRQKFGDKYVLLQKDPIIVEDSEGKQWIFTKSKRKEYGWYRYENGRPNFKEEL